MNYFLIAGGVILIVIIYYVYLYFTATSSTVVSQAYLKNSIPAIPAQKVVGYGNQTFAIGCWIYLNKTGGGGGSALTSSVFTVTDMGGTKSYASFYFGSSDNKLNFSCNTDATSSITVPNTGGNQYTNIAALPLQDWTCVVASINLAYIDFYINGKLISSQIMPNPYIAPSVNSISSTSIGIVIGSGQDLYLGQLTTWGKALGPDDVYAYYMNGNGSSVTQSTGLANYNFGMTIIPGNAPSYSYSAF